MMSRRSLLCALGASPLLMGVDAAGGAPSASPTSLHQGATARGRYFGAAVRFDQLGEDPVLRERVLRDCGSLTPEIHLKWDALRPTASDWTTDQADGLLDFADRHGLSVRGHALLWEQSTPAWARAAMAGGDWSVVAEHFEVVLGRYGDRIEEWDVINEPIGDDGGVRANIFAKAYGPGYVAGALKTARALAPRAKLVINDYSLEYDNPVEAARRRGLVQLARQLRRDGTPLDGIGLQAHLDLGKGPLKSEIIRPFLSELADLGLEIAVTELDVRETDLSLSVAERDRRVADEVARYMDIVLAEPAVKGVTTWGLSDRHSWLQGQGARGSKLNRGLPYCANWKPKAMHAARGYSLSTKSPCMKL